MKKIINHWETIFFIGLTFLFVSLNFIPFIIHSQSSPPDKFYSLVHDNENDYYLYLSLIQEGKQGDWLVTNPYDVIPSEKSIVNVFFVYLGRVGNILDLPAPIIYHLARLIFSVTLLISAYLLICEFFKKGHRLLPYLLTLVAGSFLRTVMYEGKAYPHQYMEWWRGADVLRRVALYPHHLLGATLLILTIIAILKFLKRPSKKILLAACMSSTLASLIHPPSNFIVLIALLSSGFVYTARGILDKKIGNTSMVKANKSILIGIGVFLFFSMLSLLAVRYATTLSFPWNQYNSIEVSWQFEFQNELLPGLGVVLWIALLGIVVVLKDPRDFSWIFVVCWFIVPILMMPFAPTLGISNVRLFQGYPYLPMGMLAAVGVEWTVGHLKRWVKQPVLARGVVVGLILCFTIPTIIHSYKSMMQEYSVPYSNIYLSQDVLPVADFFVDQKNKTGKNSRVLSSFYVGNYLPAFAPVQVYTGHYTFTPNREIRAEAARRFFAGESSVDEASKLLHDNRIDFVFVSGDDGWGERNKYPTLLVPYLRAGTITLFVPNTK